MSEDSGRQPLDLVPRLEDQGYAASQVATRRAWVAEKTGARLEHVGTHSMPSESMRGNVENPIGAVQLPLGVAGPLVVSGQHAKGTFYVPLATSEGALVRSYERGMAAISHAGGAAVSLERDENRVSPCFFCEDLSQATELVRWMEGSFEEIRRIAEATTRHGRLLRLDARCLGRHVVADFCYFTGDASGMNLMVKATEKACRFIVAGAPAQRFEIFSGAEIEKRASPALFHGGKGKYVVAGVRLPARVLKTVLNTSARDLAGLWERTASGHISSGAVGYNGQLANGLAAIFIACGQDVANLSNAAVGLTRFEDIGDEAIYASVTMPSLTVGTVGGGTALATSRECLEMIGCFGEGKAAKFAEIIAAALLAGEVSMGAAIASGELGAAHEALGRNRPGESG